MFVRYVKNLIFLRRIYNGIIIFCFFLLLCGVLGPCLSLGNTIRKVHNFSSLILERKNNGKEISALLVRTWKNTVGKNDKSLTALCL